MTDQTQGAGTAAGDPVTILYTNHRGETAVRRITPIAREWFGSSDWHPEPQWLFTAFDMEKEAFRDFARAGVKAWGQAAVDAALADGAGTKTAGEPSPFGEVLPDHASEIATQVMNLPWTRHGLGKPGEGFDDDGLCDRHGDVQIIARNVIGASPAPAATPGVPDSLREAFAAATDSPVFVHDFADPAVSSAPGCQDVSLSFVTPDHITAAFMGNGLAGTIDQARKDAVALAAAWNHVRALIAAQPAGQAGAR